MPLIQNEEAVKNIYTYLAVALIFKRCIGLGEILHIGLELPSQAPSLMTLTTTLASPLVKKLYTDVI